MLEPILAAFSQLLLSLPFPSQVWSEECAVRDHGHADRLQFPAGLLQELRDVYRAVCPCRHGPDLQLRGSICPGYGHQVGVEYLILCFTIISLPAFKGKWSTVKPARASWRTQFVGRVTESTKCPALGAQQHSSLIAASKFSSGL